MIWLLLLRWSNRKIDWFSPCFWNCLMTQALWWVGVRQCPGGALRQVTGGCDCRSPIYHQIHKALSGGLLVTQTLCSTLRIWLLHLGTDQRICSFSGLQVFPVQVVWELCFENTRIQRWRLYMFGRIIAFSSHMPCSTTYLQHFCNVL